MAVAIDKYICPFCGQRTLFVGVHDDEGNYKGRPGCEYESDPWSGLCYAIHHDGWGDCILCTGAHDLPLGGCFFDTAEEAFQAIPALTPPNEWVSVVERLPEEEIAPGRRQVTVLVCSKAGRVSSASRVWWPDRGWRWSKMMNNYVTHWMPLPAPPYRRPPEGEEET